jgi:hypothetical protein
LNVDEREMSLLVKGNGTGVLGKEGKTGALDERRARGKLISEIVRWGTRRPTRMLVGEIERVNWELSEGGRMEIRIKCVSSLSERSSCRGRTDASGMLSTSPNSS